MCLGTFSRRARSLATWFLFARVRIHAERFLFHRTHFPMKRKNAGNNGYSTFPAFAIFFSYLSASSIAIAVIILCLVLILVFRAVLRTVLALILHAVLTLVGTVIRTVFGWIFAAVLLCTVIIVAVTVFAWHKSFLLNSCPVRLSQWRSGLSSITFPDRHFLVTGLSMEFSKKSMQDIFTFW